tara:strand:+ start:260 stop:679 length:420 start_codon:yes stop_codon:yes gene_type:complete
MRAKGFIKLHRKIKDTKLYKDSYLMHLWLELLIRTNHKDNSWNYKGKLCSVKSGECLVSLQTLADSTGMKVSKIRSILKRLKRAEMITTESTPYHTNIKIVSWNKYQEQDKKEHRQIKKSAYNKNDSIYKPLKMNNKLI